MNDFCWYCFSSLESCSATFGAGNLLQRVSRDIASPLYALYILHYRLENGKI